MLKIIDIYIIKKFLGTFVFAIIIIVCFAILFHMSEQIDDFMDAKAPIKAIFADYYVSFIPYFANLFSHLFTLIAVVFFTAKMASNNEIIAVLSNGMSFNRLLLPYAISAVLIATFSFVLNSYVIPKTNISKIEFENEYLKKNQNFLDRHIHKQINPGVYIYIETYNTINNIGYKFSIDQFENGELKSKLISDYVKWDTTLNKWAIFNYYIRTFTPQGEVFLKGDRKDTTLNILPEDFTRKINVIEAMNNSELDHFIKHEQMRGAENIETYMIEKYRRYASPFAVFILTLIGVSLASRRRGGVGLNVGVGIGLSFAYILFMQVSSQFAISGNMNPMLAVWTPNIIFFITSIVLYYFAPK